MMLSVIIRVLDLKRQVLLMEGSLISYKRTASVFRPLQVTSLSHHLHIHGTEPLRFKASSTQEKCSERAASHTVLVALFARGCLIFTVPPYLRYLSANSTPSP
jgi:hypothetical protein